MHSFDSAAERLLLVFMRAVLTPNSLRAARGLSGLSRPIAAKRIGVSVVTLSGIESGMDLTERLDERFREFYDKYGIELSGWIDTTTGIAFGEGARWKGLAAKDHAETATFWPDRNLQNYQVRAARSLLRLSAEQLGEAISASRNTVSQVENGKAHRRDTNERLRRFFQEQGLEFLGIADTSERTLISGGVRKRVPENAPPEILNLAIAR